MSFDLFVYIVELISITAISISGALVGAQRKLDAFGVVCTGVTASLGGGVLRDLIIGITPPFSFNRPLYAITAAVCSVITFIVEYRRAKKHLAPNPKADKAKDLFLFVVDSIGLGTFTVVGVAVPFEYTTDCNLFTIIFVGALTGVGGGVLRDILVSRKPYIFVKHFYASAAIIGSIVTAVLWTRLGKITSMITGIVLIFILRLLAARFKWNMPVVPYPEEDTDSDDERKKK